MKALVILFVTLLFISCAPVSSFRSPEVLDEGEKVFGIGNSLFQFEKDDFIVFNPNL